ncbi:MAG: HEAT repeat domain-containing protein [Gammaproteobacteria bacterium]|nr:MAG: HEAT repeat domain-containing protein [Gammaproteobacteria bacterium]
MVRRLTPRHLLSLLPLAAGLGLEGRVWALALAGRGWEAAGLQGLAAALQALALAVALHPRLRPGMAPGLLVPWLLAWAVPVLGGLGCWVVLGLLPYRAPPRLDRVVEPVEPPPLPLGAAGRAAAGPAGLSVGTALGILERAPAPEVRIRAVLATRHMEERDAVSVLRVALRDPADEVRLLAYALLERREKRLSAAIRRLAAGLEGLPPARRAAAHQRLAELHWEMAYLGLATGEVLRHYLEEARRHARLALAEAPPGAGAGRAEEGLNRAELHFLLARVALRLEEPEEAHRALVAAAAAGLPRNRLLPYLAEVAFQSRRYGLIPGILAGLDREVYRPELLVALEAQWLPGGSPPAPAAGEGAR